MQTYQIKIDKELNSRFSSSEDAVISEEFIFKPLVQFQRPLKLIQRLSCLTILIAMYQLTYGGFSFSYLPSSFNLASTMIGVLSLILSIFLLIWSTKALKVELDKTLLTQDMIDKALEKISRVLLLLLSFRVAASCVMIPIMISQGNLTLEHLWAYNSTYNTQKYSAVANILKNLSIPLPFLELFSCMTFMYAAWASFRYVKSPSQLMSTLVSISNTAFMASALALVFSTLSIERSLENLLVPSLMPQWNVTGLKYAGILGGVMAGFIWLVNSKKWRVPSLLMTGLMTALVLSVGALTVNSYTSAHSVSEFYQDTTDMNIWNVDQKDIEAFGCPAKYLPSQKCQGSVLINRWEQTPADSKPSYCLNIACSDILGSLYSSPFLQMSNWALASVVSGLIVIAGSLYLSMTRFRDTAPRSKKDYGWLGVLIAMAIIFTVAVNTYTSPSIHEKGSSMEGPFQTEDNQILNKDIVLSNILEYKTGFLESNDELNEPNLIMQRQEIMIILMSKIGLRLKLSPEDGQEFYKMVMSKSYRFIVLSFDLDNEKAAIEAKGDWESSYNDFLQNFHTGEARVGMIYLEVEGQTRLTVVILENDSLAEKRKELSNITMFDTPNVEQEKIDVYFYMTRDPYKLSLDSVMKEINSQANEAKKLTRSYGKNNSTN